MSCELIRFDELPNRVDEKADRDGLGKISLAPALADALLVPLHGERRDRDHRNVTEVFVVLDPLRDLEPGNFGELDVHQDEIGTMGARERERVMTVPGLDGCITMGLE